MLCFASSCRALNSASLAASSAVVGERRCSWETTASWSTWSCGGLARSTSHRSYIFFVPWHSWIASNWFSFQCFSQWITYIHFLSNFLSWSLIVSYFAVYRLSFPTEILQMENRFFSVSLLYLCRWQLFRDERLDICCLGFPCVVRFVKFLNEVIFILLMLSLALLLIGFALFGECSNASNPRFRFRLLLEEMEARSRVIHGFSNCGGSGASRPKEFIQ